MISFDHRDKVAEATAFRLGVHEELSNATGSRVVASAGSVEHGTIFCVLHFSGWPDPHDNGWALITAPDAPDNHRLIDAMIRANYTTTPTIRAIIKPGRN